MMREYTHVSICALILALISLAAAEQCYPRHAFGPCEPWERDPTTHVRYKYYYFDPPGLSPCNNPEDLPEEREGPYFCDQVCGPGMFLTDECETCPANTYAPGGGFWWQVWDSWPVVDDVPVMQTKCASLHNNKWELDRDCEPWQLNGKTIDSGNNKGRNNVFSILDLQLMFVREGYIRFNYKVDCEKTHDALDFLVDHTKALSESSLLHWTEFKVAVSAGPHTFQWMYRKDGSLTVGADKAEIELVEVVGTSWSDFSCTSCPKNFQSTEGSARCSYCGRDYFVDSNNNYNCTACPEGTYSFAGWSECKPRPTCSEDDLALSYGPCQGNTRFVEYDWLEPKICVDGISKPEPEAVPCSPCNPGQYRQDSVCKYCSEGFFREEDNGESEDACNKCPPGSHAPKKQILRHFSSWPNSQEENTKCSGECGTQGWRLKGDYIDSGAQHGENLDSVFQLNVTLSHPGNVWFNYSVEAPHNGEMVFYIDDSAVIEGMKESLNSHKWDLAVGQHLLQWNYRKRASAIAEEDTNDRAMIHDIVIQGVEDGGAAECLPCPPGTFLATSGSHCQKCPPGQWSDSGATSCQKCPANTYNPEHGGDQYSCVSCGEFSFSDEGSAWCDTHCIFEPVEGVQYDLSPLRREDGRMYGPVRYGAREFFLNMCTLKHDKSSCTDADSGESVETVVCETTVERKLAPVTSPDVGREMACHELTQAMSTDSGKFLQVEPRQSDPRGGVDVVYSNGEDCTLDTHSQQRSTRIQFECDLDANKGIPEMSPTVEVTDPACDFTFRWKSAHACRLCKYEDFDKVVGPCKEGKRTTTFVRREVCFEGGAGKKPEPLIEDCEALGVKVTPDSQTSVAGTMATFTLYFSTFGSISEQMKLVLRQDDDMYTVPAMDTDEDGMVDLHCAVPSGANAHYACQPLGVPKVGETSKMELKVLIAADFRGTFVLPFEIYEYFEDARPQTLLLASGNATIAKVIEPTVLLQAIPDNTEVHAGQEVVYTATLVSSGPEEEGKTIYIEAGNEDIGGDPEIDSNGDGEYDIKCIFTEVHKYWFCPGVAVTGNDISQAMKVKFKVSPQHEVGSPLHIDFRIDTSAHTVTNSTDVPEVMAMLRGDSGFTTKLVVALILGFMGLLVISVVFFLRMRTVNQKYKQLRSQYGDSIMLDEDRMVDSLPTISANSADLRSIGH